MWGPLVSHALYVQVLFKPLAGRLQVDTGLEGPDSANYSAPTKPEDQHLQRTHLKLQASVTALPATFAAAFVR